ncbi:lysophospholipid acyltransferase family protein [Ostreiculturibacter nitratireducens]|uniref:lysophospholipid acyltransferase family protein n=1 Tax=Ostreiculturibacter nitratireducens TaxID=3075226 RepID=UPI0031B6433F
MTQPNEKATLGDHLADWAFRAVLGFSLLFRYERRVAMAGWLTSHLVAPLAGYRSRVRENLALACPDMPRAEVERLARAVPDNAGRALAEIYSGKEFLDRIAAADPLEGPGLPVLEAAHEAGKPVILAVAHFGNYDAMRAALVARGFTVGAVYRPMQNPVFNKHYVRAIHRIAEPLFPRNRAGLVEMVRFLRKGGFLALGTDQHMGRGTELRFFGLPAKTTLNPAELALKYDCEMVPVHAIRQPDGLSFVVRVDAPIPKGTPEEMMQAVNDNLEAVVREHMDQWFWIHRRWKQPKPKTRRKRA